jgi:hypothetical protein
VPHSVASRGRSRVDKGLPIISPNGAHHAQGTFPRYGSGTCCTAGNQSGRSGLNYAQQCPKTEPHIQACKTTDIKTCPETKNFDLCIMGDSDKVENGPFGCKTSAAHVECLDGTKIVLCFTRCKCFLNDHNQCVPGTKHCTKTNAVEKIKVDCPKGS